MKINTLSENKNPYSKFLQVKEVTHDFLKKSGFLEIDLPVLSPALVPESYLEVFETDFIYSGKKEKLYLTPSPELFLKRLLSDGIGDCYYLGKSFRNSERSSDRHSFEFNMLEFYRVNADYLTIAKDTLKLLQSLAKRLYGATTITYQGNTINLDGWEKLTIAQAFKKYADIPINNLFEHEKFLLATKAKGYNTRGFTYEDVFSQIYTQEVEPHLGMNGQPTLLYDYPKEFAALAKLNPDRKTAQRFEFYIGGVELGDCYTELTDPKEQMDRFMSEDEARKKVGRISHPVDTGFIEALEKGLPDCAGIAIGFDRLAMVFADATSIDDLKLISIR